MSEPSRSTSPQPSSFDAVVVGASLAGCATAIGLGRAGARVALLERNPDPAAFKRTCSHYVQAGSVPAFERLGLLEDVLAAGGIRSGVRVWTRWGWLDTPPERAGQGLNLRRERLDPLIRETAAGTPGVELMLGSPVHALHRDGGAVRGVRVRDRAGVESELRAQLVVGADGRDSRVAELAGVKQKALPHGRFAYGAYFEDAAPTSAPDATVWFLDPQWAAGFPTDDGLVFYAAMPTKDRLPEFKRDPEAALRTFLADLPEPPPTEGGRIIGPVVGKLEMPNRVRATVAPGLALVGDAALATDPLMGIGCGWAVQSAEWLVERAAGALRGAEPLEHGLRRYRRRHARELRGHAFFIHDYATGRRFNSAERMLFSAATRDPATAAILDEYATRRIKPSRAMIRAVPRALAVNARHALAGRRAERGAGGRGLDQAVGR